jgi:hypothetical protein
VSRTDYTLPAWKIKQLKKFHKTLKQKHEADVNVTDDAMQTFVWYSDFGAVLGIDPSGGGGVKFENNLRNGSSFSIIAVKRGTDVPERATLAILGLCLAGLGLAKKKKKSRLLHTRTKDNTS